MPFTEYFDSVLASLALSDSLWTPPADWYVGLSSTAPTQNDGGNLWNVTEPASGLGYARQTVANNSTSWVAAGGLTTSGSTSGWTMENNVVVSFGPSTGSWGNELTYFFLADGPGALSPGTVNVCLFGALNPPQTVGAANITLSFGVAQLTVTLD